LSDRLFHENRTPLSFQTGSVVLAETSGPTTPPKSVRPLAGPGKPLALRMSANRQATAPVSPGCQNSEHRGPARRPGPPATPLHSTQFLPPKSSKSGCRGVVSAQPLSPSPLSRHPRIILPNDTEAQCADLPMLAGSESIRPLRGFECTVRSPPFFLPTFPGSSPGPPAMKRSSFRIAFDADKFWVCAKASPNSFGKANNQTRGFTS